MAWAVLFVLLLIGGSGIAFRYGGSLERLGMGIVLAGSVATPLVLVILLGDDWSTTAYAVLVIDMLALAAFGVIAMRSDRFWPLWVTGMQLAQMTTHLARMANAGLVPNAYETGQAVWAWLQILVIAIAAWNMRHQDEEMPKY